MKKSLLCCTLALAATGATASEYGCKVLLCLATPASNGGPKGVAECVAPIEQLEWDMAHGRPFPRCDASDGNDSGNYAQPVFDAYDPCPNALKPAGAGGYVVAGKLAPAGSPFAASSGYIVSGAPQVSEAVPSRSPRACVGKPMGTYQVGSQDDGYAVSVFDQVVWQQAQSPRAIDLFINGQWRNRTHW